ncbi:Putative prenylated rab acceptor PRA1 [Colletotrichum destructivum]|uniref:PRA1 family protein n=1 Tax=Colletotrichum destructivum TaxID=34406 RepID=A0AAX4I0J4_9PEZI|nr:Putative prenylated rab acceptor PRA1 [Colletotrichum destructivum]
MPSLEDLRIILSVLRENYWPYVARVLENSASSPLFDLVNPNYLTLPTSSKDLQQRIRYNFIRFHAAYIVIVTFGLFAKHWHVAAAATMIHKLGTFMTSFGRGDASLQADTDQSGIPRYAHNLVRGIWLSSCLWFFSSLYSMMTTTLQFAMVFAVHAVMLNSKARLVEKQS